MQLGVWEAENFKVNKGEDSMINYESTSGVFRKSCSKCGSFTYKDLGGGNMVAPLGALE
jgi:hypothetical protein